MTKTYTNLEGTGLQEIFSIQASFMEQLFNSGKLCRYPLEWKSYKDQDTLREYIGYTMEEVGEFLIGYRGLSEKLISLPPLLRAENINELFELRRDVAHELSDILAFNTELLILLGITPRDIHGYMTEICKELEITNIIRQGTSDILEDLIALSSYFNITSGLTRIPKLAITLVDELDYPLNHYSGDRVSAVNDLTQELMLDLLKVRMPLKAKPWRDNPPKMSLSAVVRPLLDSYINLFRLFSYLRYDKWQVVELFKEKHTILNQRMGGDY